MKMYVYKYMGTAKNTPKLLLLSSADLFKMSLSNILRLMSLYNLQQLIVGLKSFRNTLVLEVDTHKHVLYNYVHLYVNTCTYEHVYILYI